MLKVLRLSEEMMKAAMFRDLREHQLTSLFVLAQPMGD
jgi:hypothetical protein